jgi:eukaryotic-like serine/threonine-protein kinase
VADPSPDIRQSAEASATTEVSVDVPVSQAVTGAEDCTTGCAPSFRAPLESTEAQALAAAPALPNPGDRLHDFEILHILGTGAFATVYLARQVSLDRQVALKLSANRGNEARTLASLEHDHIVRVFSEVVTPEQNLRLLCMQYVSGTTLERIIRALAKRPRESWNGPALLETIDALSPHPALFDPAALRDRELLMACDWPEAVCWLGTRLAEALAHAHNLGVLHRDIKPANILLNRYGRPLLADFNVSLDPQRMRDPAGEVFGGTLAYMAPEHIDAFNPETGVTAAAVDARSDIYALGLVLFELLTGRLPFVLPPRAERTGDVLRQVAEQRRTQAAPSPRDRAEVPEVLNRVVRRCLDPLPENRYQSAAELARATEGAGEHRRLEQALPSPGLLTRAALRAPFLVGVVLLFLPHVVGSVVNISYNAVRIVGSLTVEQQSAFVHLLLGYNLVVYPLALFLTWRIMLPIWRGWRLLTSAEVLDTFQVDELRRRLLRLPLWTAALSCAGWLPGGLLFPLGIAWLAGPLGPHVFGHFLVSFTIAGLIALTYSVLGVQFVVLRALYPRAWDDAQDLRRRAALELRTVERNLHVLQLLAGAIPLAGAVLMVGVGPEQQFTESGYWKFRLLVTGLIALGMVGFSVALSATAQLRQTLKALKG